MAETMKRRLVRDMKRGDHMPLHFVNRSPVSGNDRKKIADLRKLLQRITRERDRAVRDVRKAANVLERITLTEPRKTVTYWAYGRHRGGAFHAA
jgi:hypothetical protein